MVLVRALTQRGELLSGQGRIAVGWLIVEDLFTVVVLVLLPSLAAMAAPTSDGGIDLVHGRRRRRPSRWLRAGLLALLVIVVGARVVPPLLAYVARLRDRELFTLAAVAIALGIAYVSYAVFGVSLALGAFLAGAIVSESDTSHQVAADATPIREVFSVLFFVVGRDAPRPRLPARATSRPSWPSCSSSWSPRRSPRSASSSCSGSRRAWG